MFPLWRRLAHQPAGVLAGLAAELGLPVPQVVTGLEALAAAGVPVGHGHGLYWCLPAPVPLLASATLLTPLCEHVELHDTLASTQDRVLELLRGQPGLTQALVAAEQQTAGRGRSGAVWLSPLGAHLTFSLGLRLPRSTKPAQLAPLPVRLGLAVVRALARHGVPARLKWPNDLWLAGRKLGGLLVELHTGADGATLVVIGLGLNHRMPAGGPWPDQPWIDLAAASLQPDSRAEWLERLVPELLATTNAVVEYREADHWHRDFPDFDALCGQAVRTMQGAHTIDGVASGIGADGRLCLMTEFGPHWLGAGEIQQVRGSHLQEPPWHLRVDCGNTRLKWAWSTADGGLVLPGLPVPLRDAEGLAKPAARVAAELSEVIRLLAISTSPARILICSSSGGDRAALEQALAGQFAVTVEPQPATPATLGRWRNAYAESQRLGLDRALAMRAVLPLLAAGERALLVSVGSAMTLDVLDADGQHQGGLIGASPHLMAEALHQLSPRLDPTGAQFHALARNTPEAVWSASVQAAAALVDRVARAHGVQRLVFSGGGAGPVLAVLESRLPMLWLEGAVLRGLTCADANL